MKGRRKALRPMKNYLNIADVVMWIILITAKLVLCLSIVKKRFFNRLPLFSALIFFSTVKSFLLYILAFWANYVAYYHTFYISGYVESLLIFLTLIECGRQVLPGLNLPQKEKALTSLLASLEGVVIFASFWPLNFVENRVEMGAYLGIAVVFIFIAAYSRYLGLYWSRLLAGITATLGSLYLVEGATGAMIGHYPPEVVQLVREIRQIANILAVVSWIVVILSPWGERELTEEGLKKIEDAFARIEASVGVGGD
jgi:hypothetical protein